VCCVSWEPSFVAFRGREGRFRLIGPFLSRKVRRNSNVRATQPLRGNPNLPPPHQGCPIMPIHGGKGMTAFAAPCNSLGLLYHPKHTCVSHFVLFAQFRSLVGATKGCQGLGGHKVGGFMYLANMCAKVLGGLNLGMASCSERQRRYRSSRTRQRSSGEDNTPRPGNHPGSAGWALLRVETPIPFLLGGAAMLRPCTGGRLWGDFLFGSAVNVNTGLAV